MGNSYEEYLKTLGSKYNISESRWSGASKQSEQSSASGFPSGGNQSSYESYIADIRNKYNIDSGSERKPLRSFYIPTNEELEVSRYFSDYNRLVEGYGNRLDSIGWADGIGANTELKASIDGFAERDQDIRKYLEENRGSLNPDYYNEVISGLDSAAEAMRMLQDTYDRNAMYFSQWSSEEDYQKWLDYSTPENRQARYAENQARLEELYRQRYAERARSSQYSPGQNPYTSWNAAASGSVPYGAARQAPEQESDLDREIAAIEAEMRMYERGGTDENGFYYGSKVIDDYGKLRDNADFGAVSGIRTYHNAGKDELDAYDASQSEGSLALNNGGYYDEHGNIRDAKGNIVQYANAPAVEDKLGMFLAASDEDIADAYNLLSVSGGNYETTWADIMQEGDVNRWRFLKPEEIEIYYYLLGSQGQEAAYKYLDDMEVELGRRENEESYAAIEGANGWEKAGLSALSVIMNMAGGVASTVDNASRLIQGKELNPYSRAQSLTNASGYIRSATARDIIEATGGVEIPGLGFSAGDAYQAGMSMIDSLVGARLGGTAYQAIMSMGAASSEANRLYDQGASTDQIVLGSAAAGTAEWFFEKYSIENLISMKSPETIGQFLKNAFIQGGIEFSEEAATEIANIISNGLIMQSQSDWEKLLEENGGDYGAAIKEMAIQVTNAGLGGFLSGFGSGAIQQGIAYGTQQKQNGQIGQYISGGDGTDALMALALDMASGSDGKSQRRLRSQVNSLMGDKYLTQGGRNRATGRLYNTVRSVMTEQNIGEISAALQEQGFSKKDASKIAGALAMNYNGIELTAQQEKLVQKYGNDQKVLDAISKVIDNGESGIRQRANSMARFEFGTMLGNVASRMNQEAPGQEKSAAEGNLSGENSAVQTDSYEVSDDGQTRLISDPEKVVSVVGIASLENGKVMLNLKDGSTVDADDVSFGDSGDALIYSTVAGLGLSVDTANTIIGAFDSGKGVSAQMYALGLQEAYRNGKYNYAFQTTENDPYSSAMKLAWNEGRMSALSESGTRQAEVDAKYSEAKKSGKEKNGEYKAVLDDGITEESMTESQKASYRLADSIAQAAKVDIIVYAGKTGELGFYDPKTDTIHLNLNGTNRSGKSMMAFTLGHELVHRAKKGSPAKYQAFADFLVENYGKRGADLEAMIAEQLAAAKEHGKKMTRDQAFEEVVCDACQRMLLDTDAGKKLAQFGAESRQNKSILSEIKRWIEEFMEKLREIFKGVEPDSLAAKEFAKFDDGVKQILADMYVDMTVDAGEKLGAKDKKLGSEDKARLKQMREEGAIFKLPVTQNTPYRRPAYDKWDVSAALDDALDHADARDDNMIRVGEIPHFISDMLGINGDFYIYRNHAYENMVSEKQALKDSRPTMRKKKKIHFHDLGKQIMQDAILALENPIMTIADSTGKENPQIVMILPVEGHNDAPLYAAMSFYDDQPINGSFARRPHLVLTVAERGIEAEDGHDGYVDVVNEALNKGRLLSLDKEKMRAYMPVIADLTRVGNIADSALAGNIARFRKEINTFREKNRIDYKLPVGEDTSPRALLANAYEELAKTDAEKESIRKYQERVTQFQELETKLKDLRAQIRELYTADGKLDTKKIRELQFEANATANRIETLDRMLLRTESTQQFKNVLKREQDQARAREIKKAKDAVIAFRHDASAEIRETMRDYEAARSALVGRDSDMDIIEREFLRVVKKYEKAGKLHEADMKTMEREFIRLSKQYDSDTESFEREFNRLVKEYEKAGWKIERLKKRVEGRNKTVVMNKIKAIGSEFRNMLDKPGKSASRHAPRSLIGAVAEVCELLADSSQRTNMRLSDELRLRQQNLNAKVEERGLTKTRKAEADIIARKNARIVEATKKVKALQEQYAKMKGDPDNGMFYDEHIEKLIEQLAKVLYGTDIYDMTMDQLRDTYNTLKAIRKAVVDANKVISMGETKRLSEVVKNMSGQIDQVNVKANGLAIAARRYMMWQMSPDTFFDYICGYIKGNEGQAVQKMFSEGTRRMLSVQRQFDNRFQHIFETENKDNLKYIMQMTRNPMKDTVDWGLKDAAGNPVQTSRGMMLQAYMLLKQKDSFESIIYGGLKIPKSVEYYKGNIDSAYGDASYTELFSEAIGEKYESILKEKKNISDDSSIKSIVEKYDNVIKDLNNLKQMLEDGGLSVRDADRAREEIEILEQEAMELVTAKEKRTEELLNDLNKRADELLNAAEKRATDLLNAIEKKLTAYDREIIKTADEWYRYSGQLMSEVFEGMYGYAPALVDNYVPIHRDLGSVKIDIREADADKAFNLENSGFTKERVKSNAPILLTDFFAELNNQKSRISRYYGFAQVQKDFNRIWNMRIPGSRMTLKEKVGLKFGKGDTKTIFGVSGEKYVEHYISSIAGVKRQAGLFDGLYGNLASATLSLNPRVAVSQLASIPTASAIVGWKSMAVGFTKGIQTSFSKDKKRALAQNSEWFYSRYKGAGGITEIAELNARGGLWSKFANSKVGKWFFNWCQTFDVLATSSMWAMAEDYVQAKGFKADQDGYKAEVARVYEDIIRKSQPNYTETERSDFLRDKRSGMKLFNMYKTQSNQNLNILIDANGTYIRMKRDLKNGLNGVTKSDVQAAGANLANAVSSVTIGGTLTFVALRTMINFLFGWVKPYKDDDTDEVTEEETIKGITNEILSSLSGMFALGGTVFDVVIAVVSGDKFYGLTDSAIGAISDVVENSVKTAQMFTDPEKMFIGEEKKFNWGQVEDEIRSVLTAFGVPYNNARNIIDSAAMWYRDIRDGKFGQYSSTKTTKKQYMGRILKGYRNGDEEKCKDVIAYLLVQSDEDDEESAEKAVLSDLKSYLKDLYLDKKVSRDEVSDILKTYFEVSDDELYWMFDKWGYAEENGSSDDYAKYGEFFDAVTTGKNLSEVIRSYTDNGVDMETLRREITEHFQPVYSEMTAAERAGIREYLINAYVQCGSSREDAEGKLQYWDFLAENPGSSLSIFQVADYYEYAKPAGISAEVYSDYCERVKGITGEGKKARRMAVIDALPITNAQKDALYFAEGWAESKLHEAPWH